jgi:hypothetical protein
MRTLIGAAAAGLIAVGIGVWLNAAGQSTTARFDLAGCAYPSNISLERNLEGPCNLSLGNTQSSARGQSAG